MTYSFRTVLAATAVCLSLAAFSAAPASATPPATAANTWQTHHPARAKINDRLAHQNQRIHQEVKEGEMSHAQAARLHRADRRVRATERRMASHHGSHLTKAEQRRLNRRENHVSHRIGQ